MCGIVGVISCNDSVSQLIYDSLIFLQHRGQESAGIATYKNNRLKIIKDKGYVKDIFLQNHISYLNGNNGLGQVRYSTSGSNIYEESQPFYVNYPFGIALVHNGNLTNFNELKKYLSFINIRHVNTDSDSEILLNILANELQKISNNKSLNCNKIFQAISSLHNIIKGGYAVVVQILGYGLLAFRDPNGIRPLCLGYKKNKNKKDWMVTSESIALEGNNFKFFRDIKPGEAVFIDLSGNFYNYQCSKNHQLSPCIFEYIYFARPDSVIDNILVYEFRLLMGEYLAKRINKYLKTDDIDVVIPIPDSSRLIAIRLASIMNLKYREGLVKNMYVGRTFIIPKKSIIRKSIRKKINVIKKECFGKNVLLIDDSIVRGNTSREIVNMVRLAGANKVFLASASPPVIFPNYYGINISSKKELIAHGNNNEQIAKIINVDKLIYQKINDIKKIIFKLNPSIKRLEASCFDGDYVTGDIKK